MKKSILLCAVLVALTACNGNSDNNKSLDYETLDVNFTLKSDLEIPDGTEFGVVAQCARDGQQGVNMCSKSVASYKASGTSSPQRLSAMSEEDKILARDSDHGFSFYAISPYRNNVDVSAMQVSLPAVQDYSEGIFGYIPLVAAMNVVSVLPDVEFNVKTPFSVLNLSVPADIVEEGVPATLKSLSFTPSDESLFQGALCGDCTIDMKNDKLTLTSGKGKSMTLNFPEGGLKLEAAGAVLPVVVLPFENPEGGFDITFTDVNGKSYTTSFLNQDSDAGRVIASGEIVNVNVTRSSDGVIPVTFPVVFPLGVDNEVRNFTEALQPKWVGAGYWSCPSQPQAYCQWNKVSDPSDKYQQKLETVNNGQISSPGVKGIWTGDNFEFVIPVKKFAAGTSLTIKFPIYGRQQPVFWNINYLDGEEWKTADKQMIVSNDPAYSMECSFAMKRGGIVVEKTMKFENAIKSGYIHVKVECADGSVQASADTKFAKRTMPYTDSKGYGAPFYLYCADSEVKSVSFSIE